MWFGRCTSLTHSHKLGFFMSLVYVCIRKKTDICIEKWMLCEQISVTKSSILQHIGYLIIFRSELGTIPYKKNSPFQQLIANPCALFRPLLVLWLKSSGKMSHQIYGLHPITCSIHIHILYVKSLFLIFILPCELLFKIVLFFQYVSTIYA